MTEQVQEKLTILPLGGLGEIGMNMMAVAYGGEAFVIDAGLMFPDDSMPGVDLVLPDIDVLLQQGWNIRGIVVTHGHEDHIGALPYVLEKINAPLFATNLTMGLVEYRLDEFDLLGSTTRTVIGPHEDLQLGPFRICFVPVCHSVADGVGLLVTTPAGILMHSGDFKLDPTPIDGRPCDLEKIASFARKGIMVLMSDSTNAEQGGATLSESMIRPAFETIFREAPGRILIATFSSNIHRIQQVLDLCHEMKRKVVLVGRSMVANTRIANARGYLDIPPDTLMEMKDLGNMPDQRVTILSTGSQGEPMSALSLMALDKHKHLKINPGDTVVLSSRFIPGNEKAINQIINEFCRRGAQVMYEKVSNVHVSGHASEEELRYLIRLVRPSCFIPIHGEYRHLLRHGHIAIEEGVPKDHVLVATDGDMIEVSRDGIAVTKQLEAGRVFVHGKGVGDIGHNVLRDRRALSETGLIVVALGVSRETGKLASEPEVHSIGVTFEDAAQELHEGITRDLNELLSDLAPCTMEQWEAAKEEIRLVVRRCINKALGRKPVVKTVLLKV